MNQMLFNIGVFPWVMMASTFLFCRPESIALACCKVRSWIYRNKKPNSGPAEQKYEYQATSARMKWIIVTFLVVFAVYQVAMPLRCNMYPGGALWNGHGYRYSWRMKLNNQECEFTTFAYHNVTQEWFEVPSDWFLTERQYQKSISKPEFLLQHAHLVSKTFAVDKVPSEVYSLVMISISNANVLTLQRPFAEAIIEKYKTL